MGLCCEKPNSDRVSLPLTDRLRLFLGGELSTPQMRWGGMVSPKCRDSFAMRLRLTSAWSNVGVRGVGGKVYCIAVRGIAVEGVGGSGAAKRLSEGDTGTVFRRMKSGVGASFVRPCFVSEKPGRDMGNISELPLDDWSDKRDDEGEDLGESDPNDDLDDEAEWEYNEPSGLDGLEDFLAGPTGKRVMGSSEEDSRR